LDDKVTCFGIIFVQKMENCQVVQYRKFTFVVAAVRFLEEGFSFFQDFDAIFEGFIFRLC
jgi:hypothetical protein